MPFAGRLRRPNCLPTPFPKKKTKRKKPSGFDLISSNNFHINSFVTIVRRKLKDDFLLKIKPRGFVNRRRRFSICVRRLFLRVAILKIEINVFNGRRHNFVLAVFIWQPKTFTSFFKKKKCWRMFDVKEKVFFVTTRIRAWKRQANRCLTIFLINGGGSISLK